MPFGYGIGDRRAYILDIPLEPLVGENLIKIVRPAGRRLNSRLPGQEPRKQHRKSPPVGETA